MPRRGKPVRLGPGIYRHTNWIRVIAKCHGVQREEHFPLDTDLVEMERWQLRTKTKILETTPARPAKGTLTTDVTSYLATLTGRRKKDDRALLQHWTRTPLGAVKRSTITRAQVKAQLATWETAGSTASSINHRLRVLRNLYRELNTDEDDQNPTLGIKKRREPDPQNHAHSYDLLEAIIAFMPDLGRTAKKGESRGQHSLGKARARVMLWTGLPPAQLAKVKRSDFDPKAGTLKVTGRRKGTGTKPTTIPLLPQGVNALTLFFAAKAEGSFSTASFYKQWKRAQERLLEELRRVAKNRQLVLPRFIRPYDLRHSFGAQAYRVSRNLLGVRKLLLHARLSTSERYMEGAVDESASAVVEAWQQDTRP